jgi:hypothetical protein
VLVVLFETRREHGRLSILKRFATLDEVVRLIG